MESESFPKGRREFSFQDRLHIIETVNGLPPVQFDELCFALNPPKGIVPANVASQEARSRALLTWAEGPTGPGLMYFVGILQNFVDILQKIGPEITQPEQSPKPKGFAGGGNMGDILQNFVPVITQPEQSPKPKGFAGGGNMGDLSPAIVQLWRQKTDGDQLISLVIDINEDSPLDEVANELANLCKALNAYHIACGGNGLEIDDWEILTAVRELVGV